MMGPTQDKRGELPMSTWQAILGITLWAMMATGSLPLWMMLWSKMWGP